METGAALLLATAIFTVALSRLKIYIRLSYRRNNADDTLRAEVYLARKLASYAIDLPVVSITGRNGLPWLETEIEAAGGDVETRAAREQKFVQRLVDIFFNKPRKWRHIIRELRYYTALYRKLTRKLQRGLDCERLCWRTCLGTGDAAATGIAAGGLWALKDGLFRSMRRRINRTARPELLVKPLYLSPGFEVEFECIFSIRLGNVITAMTTLIFSAGKGAKGSGRASHPKPDENCHGKH